MKLSPVRLCRVLAVASVLAQGCGVGETDCKGSISGIASAAPNDPMWEKPGTPSDSSVCLKGTVKSGLEFDMPDGRRFRLDFGCGAMTPCPSGKYTCKVFGVPGGDPVYARVGLTPEDDANNNYVDDGYRAGAYGSGQPYEKTSCSLELSADSKNISGSFDGVLGALRIDGKTVDQQRVSFQFTGVRE